MCAIVSCCALAFSVSPSFTDGAQSAQPHKSAKRLSPARKAAIRRQLLRTVKRNPAIIRRKAFVRRAALVNFVLPVTIRLRNPCDAAQNPAATGTATCTWQGTALNEDTPATANVNLGPSLGQRTIALGGSLAGEVRFNDTFDGGALGNVAIKLLPSSSKFLKTSSVPLLWNSDIGDPGTRSDANYMRALARAGSGLNPGAARQGCGDFTSSAPGSTAATPSGYNAFAYGLTPPGSTFGVGNGQPGYPYYDAGGPGGMTTPAGYLPIYPGAEGIDRVRAGSVVGDNDFVGPNPMPFPYAATTRPGGAYGNASDTVLRTGALDLKIAPAGVQVDGASGTSTPAGPTGLDNGPQGTQSIVTGQSGGEANLFGNIPGKGHSIDVTVNLSTAINAIARITDQDVFNTPLKSGDPYPAHVFNCRQVWLGAVQNYIPGVRLKGNLRIAPAITKDGKLRIAKATVQSSQDTHLALSACLFPHSPYAKPNANTTLNTAPTIPLFSTTGSPGQLGTGLWPQNSDALPESSAEEAYGPSTTYGAGAPTGAKCNTPAWKIVRDAGLTGSVDPLLPASVADGYTTTNSGAQVTVAGDINVPPLNVDVLIGDASDVPSSPPPPIPPDTYITAAPAGTTSATSATITFMASQPSATFECRLDFGPWGVCSSPDALAGLSNGSHTFEVRAKSTGGTYDPSPASATWTVNTSYTGPATFTGSPPPGNTVTNNPGGGSPSATIPNAAVTTPVGGPVSITPTVAGPPPPVGYSFLGQNLTITASPATPGNPLAITLALDVSGNPGILTPNDVVIFRNGSPIPDCSPNNGQANPDPCVATRSLSGGIATVTALTSAASVWNLGEQQPTDAPPPPMAEFPVTVGSSPVGITPGADGKMWFSEFNANKVGKIPTSGLNPIEYAVPTVLPPPMTTSGPAGKILGPDGNVWFLEFAASKIAQVTPGGDITEHPLPPGSGPAQLVVGPDGNFWVSFLMSSAIAKVSPSGTLLDTYPIAGNPRGITVGPDGNLWFALENAGRIGRITTGGNIDTFEITNTPNSQPFWITPGADGALWFTEGTGNKIGRITTGGQITDEYTVPTPNSTPKQITTGSDGNLWFTEYTGHKIGKVTLNGTVTDYQTPTSTSAPWSIIGGPDGNVWFTEIGGSSIGRLSLPADTTAPQTWITDGPTGTSGPSTSFSFLTTEPASATFECRLDGGAFSACLSPKTYSGLADGAHTLDVRARDAAGNVDPTPATRTWTVSPLATASGVVYDDVNNNGAKDTGEPGVGGRTVYVDLNGNHQREAGSEPGATTQASGSWTLHVPTSGGVSGEIRTVLSAGSHCSQPANPGPSDVNCGHAVTFQPNGTYAARDFGLFTIPSSMVALGDSVARGFASPPCGLSYCPQNSWSTGTTTAVNSHFQRIRAINPGMTVADNLAVGGSKMAGLLTQVNNAIAQPTDYEYVTIQIGAEDLCESDFADAPGNPDVMTSTIDFHDQFQSALNALMTGLPQARVFVGSLANPQSGYDALAASSNYPAIFANWSARHGCRNVLGDLATPQTRADALARTIAYNQALRDVCAARAPRCVFDDEWIFHEPASESEVSTVDYTHPNVAGQAHYARSYTHGFNWTLAGTAAASGVVYDDVNVSGAQSPGENGINGRTVYVDLNGNQQLDSPAEPSAVTQTIAGIQGAWQITLNDVPAGGLNAQIRTVLQAGRRCSQPASPGPAHTDCAYTVNFQRDGVYADRDFGTYDLPASMAALGDSLTQAQHAVPASSWPWPGYGIGTGLPTSYPSGCSAAVISGVGAEPRLWDCPDESWSTGTDPAVNSHFQRLRALNPGLTAGDVHNLAVSGATVGDLQAQAQAARDLNNGQGVDYVTISIGPNDFCLASALPGDTVTSAATFETRLRSAMQTLMTNNPHKPRVLLGSVINPASYYDALAGVGATAVQRWLFYQFCANVTGYTTPYAQPGAVTTLPTDPTVVASRAAAGAMSVSYSNAVQTVCAEFAPYCRYDGGAANTYTGTQASDASTQDYWHPAVSGQAKFAQLWWNAGFNW